MDRIDIWIDEDEDEPRLFLSVKAYSPQGERPRVFHFGFTMERLRQMGVIVTEPAPAKERAP